MLLLIAYGSQNGYKVVTCAKGWIFVDNRQWRRQGGQGGRLPPPIVEKDGPCNSSKFDEKIGREMRIHLRCEKIINTKYL